METQQHYTAFAGPTRLVSGPLPVVAQQVKERFDTDAMDPILIFDDQTGQQIDIDLSGTVAEVLTRLNSGSQTQSPGPPPKAGPGRPKLGVVAREVTLLPRHWEWLNDQPGGASVTLRKLVEYARRDNVYHDRVRLTQDAAFRFMNAMAGNLPGFEEVLRALYAHQYIRCIELSQNWPTDIRDQAHLYIERAAKAAKAAGIAAEAAD